MKIFEGLSNSKIMVFNTKKLSNIGVGPDATAQGRKEPMRVEGAADLADLCRQRPVFAGEHVNADIYQDIRCNAFVQIRFFCSVFVLCGICSVLILERGSRYFNPVNIKHQQSINIIPQTAQERVAYYDHRHRGDIQNKFSPTGSADGKTFLSY
jgi:hypothetical protein